MKTPKHYIDNTKFVESLTAWRQAVDRAKLKGTEEPRIPEYIGECFMAIAKHLATKPNFCNYSYRDEMQADAVENSLTYAYNFDPKISQNAFAYFSQIAYYAFIRKIQKERKQTYIRYKMLEQMVISGGACTPGLDGSVTPGDPTSLNYDNVQDFLKKFDASMTTKRGKRSSKKPTLA
jgi:hypothetical protein